MYRSTAVFVFIASLVGLGLFQLKYQVVALEDRLKIVKKDILKEEEAYHILKAEWKYFNESARVQALVSKYLKLVPMEPHQLVPLEKLSTISSCKSTAAEKGKKDLLEELLETEESDHKRAGSDI